MGKTMKSYKSLWTDLLATPHQIGFIDANGIRTRFLQAGDAGKPSLVMLHGTAGSLENFALNFRELSKHFNCYAIDLVGSGYTDKPDKIYDIPTYVEHVYQFMRSAGLTKSIVMGVSLGSWISAQLALSHPDRVAGLCLITPTGLNFYREENEAIARVRGQAVGAPTWESIKSIFYRLVHDEANHLDDMIALRLGIYQQSGYDQAMRNVLGLFTEDVWVPNLISRDAYQSLNVPTLVVVSPDDKNPVYTESGREIASLVPDAQLLEMSGVAHWPQFEDPGVFNTEFLRFAQKARLTAV